MHHSAVRRCAAALLVACGLVVTGTWIGARDVSLRVDTRMDPPRWAVLERRLLAENVPACREFFTKYFDDRGYLQCVVRWGANDGPDDAFENFNRWPELHALGAADDILEMYSKGHEGLLRQYTEARTTEVPIARQGMYYKEFIVQSDWMHHGEGLSRADPGARSRQHRQAAGRHPPRQHAAREAVRRRHGIDGIDGA